MMNVMKEMNKKKVGKYDVKLFHHIVDSEKGAVSIFTDNGKSLIHHTGHIPKTHADGIFHSMKTEKHVEDFLNAVQREGSARKGGLMGIHTRY